MAREKRYHRPHQKNAPIKRVSSAKRSRRVTWLGVLLFLMVSVMVANRAGVIHLSFIQKTSDSLALYDNGKISAVSAPSIGETQLHFIDVGQGDATLIAQDGSYALIDAGIADEADQLVYYLKSLGVETLDVFVMTHPHADHIGAVAEIFENFAVELVILPDFALIDEIPTTTTFTNALDAIQNSEETTVETAIVGVSYPLGQGTLTVVSTGVQTDNLNDISVCSLFKVGKFSMLTTGDAEQEVEQAMLESGVDLRATVFQAGHHGSTTSNRLDFLQAVQPELVVISCGVNNRYGHPHAEILENIAKVGADNYRTDLNGNVVVCYTEAQGVCVVCEQAVP